VTARPYLSHPSVQIALVVPVALLVTHPTATDGMARPVLGAAGLSLLAAVVTGTMLLGGPEGPPTWWQTTATVLGVGLLPPLLVAALGAPVPLFSLVFVLVLLVVAFGHPDPGRVALLGYILVTWFVALWWGGVRAVDLLLLHVGAGAVIAYGVLRTADLLERCVVRASVAAEVAERRAELLARMLEVHTLDRDDVLQTTVDGLEDVGFAAVSVRVPGADGLVLAAGYGCDGELVELLGPREQLPGLALQRRRVVVIDDRDRLSELGVEPSATAAVSIPAEVDGTVEVVVTAAMVGGAIEAYQQEAVELLASLTARALRRARLFADDEHTVDELRRLEQRTQDFISTVSHELRTPLTVVQGLGRTLHERWDELDPRRRDDLVRRVDGNAARLAEMVRTLLDTSALEEGRISPEIEPVELRDVLEGLLHRLASVTAAHPVRVRLDEALWVAADRSLLGNVLENLLTNIAKHTPQGTRIDISAAPTGDGDVEVEVADDGPGIAAEDLPHVLDRFYRGGDPAARPPGGLGLGLALASRILLAHGSRLDLDSAPGEGARFSFRLPRVEVPAAR
jgi:signal transduction histidine kinase